MSANGQNTPKRECTSNIESQRGAEIFYTFLHREHFE